MNSLMNTGLDLKRLGYFLAVAETMHFGKAAQKLGMAQPNLSQQIKKIEDALGHALFERTTRGVTLTAVGNFLLKRAELLQANFDETIQKAQRIGRGEAGSISIGFSGSAMYSRTPRAIARFRRRYPDVVVQLREVYPHEQLQLLLDRTLDVGFIRDATEAPGLKLIPLLREGFMAVLPKSHHKARQSSIGPKELKDEQFVLFSPTFAKLTFHRIVELFENEGFAPNIVQEAPQWVTISTLVSAGMGVSVAPACLARLKIPDVVYLPLRSKSYTTIDICASAATTNPAASLLIEIAKDEFQRHKDATNTATRPA